MSAIKEIRALTGLRGIAAVYVLLYHYIDALPGSRHSTTFIGHGYLAVDIFFVLSGFVMALNYRHLFFEKKFWTAYPLFLGRRIARIYPLYLFGTLIAYVMARSATMDPIGLASLHRTLAFDMLMVQSWVIVGSLDHSTWSISAEWAAYLVFPALLSLIFFKRSLRHNLGLTLGLASLAALACIPHFFHHQNLFSTHDLYSFKRIHFLRCLPEFTLGILAARGLGTSPARFLHSRPWVSTLLGIALIAVLSFRGTDLLFVLLLPLFLLSLTLERSLPTRLLSCGPAYFLGLVSYSLYIVHSLFVGFLVRIHAWFQFHHLPHAQSYAAAIGIAFAFSLVAVLPLSLATYKFLEIPSTRLLRRWFEGRSSDGSHPDPTLSTPPALAFPSNSR